MSQLTFSTDQKKISRFSVTKCDFKRTCRIDELQQKVFGRKKENFLIKKL